MTETAETPQRTASAEQPLVTAVLLTANRPEMTRRAIDSFWRQTYSNKNLLMLNSGDTLSFPEFPLHLCTSSGKSVGELRNLANAAGSGKIIAHWDSDDLSHPNRLAEQVALLQSSGRECVGYREVLFWNTRGTDGSIGHAWIYRDAYDPQYAIGASLCYWRLAWERRPFEHVNKGEDNRFRIGTKSLGVSAIPCHDSRLQWDTRKPIPQFPLVIEEPRLICQIHAGSTTQGTPPKEKKAEWERAPQWDAYCCERMKL